MLCKRWRKTLRNRLSGADSKPALGAINKSYGAERNVKRLGNPSQVCIVKLNESKEPLKRR